MKIRNLVQGVDLDKAKPLDCLLGVGCPVQRAESNQSAGSARTDTRRLADSTSSVCLLDWSRDANPIPFFLFRNNQIIYSLWVLPFTIGFGFGRCPLAHDVPY